MADVQIAVIDQHNTQIALAAPAETQVTAAVPGIQGPPGNVSVAQDGTAALPGIRFENDTNTGIYRPGADQLALSTNGTGRLFISDDGKIGIGTSTPSSYAIQADDLVIAPSTSSAGISLVASTANFIYFSDLDAEGRGAISYGHGDDAFRFSTAASQRLIITSNGDVNIVGAGTAGVTQAVSFNGSAPVDSLVVNSSGNVSAAGTMTAGSFIPTSSTVPTNGVYLPAANSVALSTNGVQRINIEADGDINIDSGGVFYDATNNRLAIGTTSPSEALTVAGNASFTLSGNERFSIKSSVSPLIEYKLATNNYFLTLESVGGSQGAILFNTGTSTATERARIDSSGRLLIGTSSARLMASGLTPTLQVENNDASISIRRNIAVAAALPANLVIGRARGSAFETVVSGDHLANISFSGADGSAQVTAASISAQVDGTPGANDMPGRLVFSSTPSGSASPVERMRINAAGGFKFSDTGTYTNATDALAEFRQSTNVVGLSVRSTNASFTSNVFSVRADRNASGGEYNFISAGVTGVDTRFIVANDGDVTNTNNAYGAISDIKLKENIVDANSQWDDIKALQVRNYNFKKGQTHTQIGLIAQEVELVSPGLVSESPDRDEDGNDLGTVTKSVNYSVLYMKAVKALQEAMERIETLEAKVAALESA